MYIHILVFLQLELLASTYLEDTGLELEEDSSRSSRQLPSCLLTIAFMPFGNCLHAF